MIRNAMAWFCCALVVCAPVWAQEPGGSGYQLVVVRGDDAQNNIKKGRATKAVVEVRDRNRKPVAGVVVMFALPDSGPGGSFVSGSQTASVTTDSAGQASVTYKPNNVPGQFNLKAYLKSSAEVAVILKQINLNSQGPAMSKTTITLLTVAGIGLGVGLGVGLSQGGGSNKANTVTLTPGGAVIGPPK